MTVWQKYYAINEGKLADVPFRNSSDQIEGADNEVWHIRTVQHNVKKEKSFSMWVHQNQKHNANGHVGTQTT